MPGWEIHLCPDPTALVTARTYADDDGDFVFNNVMPGKYVVRQVVPPGFMQTDPPTPSSSAYIYGHHTPIVVAGQKIKGIDFKNARTTPAPAPFPQPGPTPTPVSSAWPKNFIFGINFGGAVEELSDPSKTIDVQRHFRSTINRYWLAGPLGQAVSPREFATIEAARLLGMDSCIVINPQNSSRRSMPESFPGLTAFCNSFPMAAPTPGGVALVDVYNEVTNSDIWKGGLPAYVEQLKIISPILRAKGYKIVGGSVFKPTELSALCAIPGFVDNVDYFSGHFYASHADQAIAAYAGVTETAKKYGKGECDTEVGLHQGDISVRASESEKLWRGRLALAASEPTVQQIGIHFLMFANNSQGGGPSGLINTDFSKHQPIYAAMEKGLVVS